jgi:hypothetical protein
MNMLEGWPDASREFPSHRLGLFERDGSIQLPKAIEIGLIDGAPDVRLELFRRVDALGFGNEEFGELEIGLAFVFDESAGPHVALNWSRGQLLLQLTSIGSVLVHGVVEPNGPDGFRARFRLDRLQAILVEKLLKTGEMFLRGQLELAIGVVAPRLNGTVTFSTDAVRAEFFVLGDSNGQVIQALREPSAFGISVDLSPAHATGVDPDAVAMALIQRLIREDLIRQLPATALADPATLVWTTSEVRTVTWDLAEPVAVEKRLTLPLELGNLGRPKVTFTTIGTLDAGLRDVEVVWNLPSPLEGIDFVAVTVRTMGPGVSQVKSADFDPTSNESVTLRFAVVPGTEFSYEYTTTVLFRGSPTTTKTDPRHSDHTRLLIGPDALGAVLGEIRAPTSLLEHGTVNIGVDSEFADQGFRFDLTTAVPTRTIAGPRKRLARLNVSLSGPRGQLLPIGSWPFGNVSVDTKLTNPAKSVTLRCARATQGPDLVVFEVKADDPHSPTPPMVLTFAKAQPERLVTYFSADPFRPGFCYRPWHGAPLDPAPWSHPVEPGDDETFDLD